MKQSSQRVKDILAQMSTAEKALQLSCLMPMIISRDGVVQAPIMDKLMPHGIGRMTQFATGFFGGPRAVAEGHNAIQRYVMDATPAHVPVLVQNEAANGLVAEGATVFPVPVALASTWRPQYARQMGDVIRTEGRAVGVKVALSPVCDITRDARWGRVGEMLGEDPLLASRFAAEEARGIQSDDLTKGLVSCAKHFMGYSASETGVNMATINMGRKDLFEVWGTPFAAAIAEADMQGVMVTYSEIDGLPMSVNEYYLRQVLREDMGFSGIAICDGGSIPMCMQKQGMYSSKEQLAGRALRAGLDADTPFTQVYTHIVSGVEQGLISEDDLNESVLRVLTQKEELGLLDDPFVDVDAAAEAFARPEAIALSSRIATEEITLLKNSESVLPLASDAKVLLTGPFCDQVATYFGGYAYPSFVGMLMAVISGTSPLMEGVGEMFKEIMDIDALKTSLRIDESTSVQQNLDRYIRGAYKGIKSLREALGDELGESVVGVVPTTINGDDWQARIDAVIEASRDADVLIAAVGEVTGFGDDATSGEGVNNPDLSLPGHQEELVRALANTGKPVVLVLFNGRPLALGSVEPLVSAIVEAWYPGPCGGEAVASVLVGSTNPGGKLPVTFPRISSQCPVYYGHKSGSGYMKIDQTPDKSVLQPLFPFGHGLSYTTFSVDGLEVPDAVDIGAKFDVCVAVTNTGAVEGDEVVQIYTHTTTPTVVRPVKELRAFARVTLAPGEKRVLKFTLDTHQFGYYDADDRFVVEPSGLLLMAGVSSSDIRQTAESRLVGEPIELLHERAFGFTVA